MVILYPAVGTLPKPINCAKTVIRKPPGSHRDRWSRAPADEKGIALPTNPNQWLDSEKLVPVIHDGCWKQVWAEMADPELEDRLFTYLWLSLTPPNAARGPTHRGSGTARASRNCGKGPRDANSGSGAVASQWTRGRKKNSRYVLPKVCRLACRLQALGQSPHDCPAEEFRSTCRR